MKYRIEIQQVFAADGYDVDAEWLRDDNIKPPSLHKAREALQAKFDGSGLKPPHRLIAISPSGTWYVVDTIESPRAPVKAATAVPQLEELKEAKTKGANAYENGESLICCNPFPEGSARAAAWAQGWKAEQADQHAKKAEKAAAKRYVVNAVKNAHVSGLWGVKDTLEPVGSRFRGLATFTREQDAHDFAAMLEARA